MEVSADIGNEEYRFEQSIWNLAISLIKVLQNSYGQLFMLRKLPEEIPR